MKGRFGSGGAARIMFPELVFSKIGSVATSNLRTQQKKGENSTTLLNNRTMNLNAD